MRWRLSTFLISWGVLKLLFTCIYWLRTTFGTTKALQLQLFTWGAFVRDEKERKRSDDFFPDLVLILIRRFKVWFFSVGILAQWAVQKPLICWWRSGKAECFWSETVRRFWGITCCVLGKCHLNYSSGCITQTYFCREDTKVSHYIINKIQQGDQTVFRIGDQSFPDLPDLLAFYKLHYLDTTPLRRPAQKKVERVIGKFDFDGSVSTFRGF